MNKLIRFAIIISFLMDHLTYFTDSGAALTTNFDWTKQTNAPYVFVIEPYMERPYMVFIGDSIISGHGKGLTPDEHSSFNEMFPLTNILTTIENQWSRKLNN